MAVVTRTCTCYGDPHCYSFDADINDKSQEVMVGFSCVYTLATDGCSGGGASYEISANFERVKETLMRSYVSSLAIREGNYNVYLGQGPTAAFGSANNFVTAPYDDFGMTLREVAAGVIELTLSNGIKVRWDGQKRVEVDAASGVAICGMCGNNDGNPNNDRAMGPHAGNGKKRAVSLCPGQFVSGSPGSQAGDVEDFAKSWFKERDTQDAFCDEDCGAMMMP